MKAVTVEAGEIAGVEPTLAIDRLRRQFLRPIIAAHHVASADMQLPDLALRQRDAIGGSDAGLHAWKKSSNCMVVTGRIEPHSGDTGRTFRNAVTVGKRKTELLLDAHFQIKVERRPGNRDQPQRSAIELLDTGQGLVFQ